MHRRIATASLVRHLALGAAVLGALVVSPASSHADELGMATELADFRIQHRSDADLTAEQRQRMDSEYQTVLAQRDFTERAIAGRGAGSGSEDIYYKYAYLFHNNQTTLTTRAIGNPYGAEYAVPFGRFRGENLVGQRFERQTYEGGYQEQTYTTGGKFGLRSNSGGWSFEPERSGFLEARWDLDGYDVHHVPFNGTTGGYYNESCSVTLRYTFTGRDGTFEFLGVPEPNPAKPNEPLERACGYFHTTDTKIPDDSYLKASDCRDQARLSCQSWAEPKRFWSTNGQVSLDMSDPAKPKMTFPDGSVTELADDPGAYLPFNAGLMDQASGFDNRPLKLWGVRRVVDASGNETRFARDSVTDPRGRVTHYDRGPNGRVERIRKPAPGGSGELVWTMTWTELTWSLDDFGAGGSWEDDFLRRPEERNNRTGKYTTLTALALPDGRSYRFFYGIDPDDRSGAGRQGFGRLARVETPGGAVTTFHYGGPGTPSFTPIDWPTGIDRVPSWTWLLDTRLVERRDYPNGAQTAPLVTRFEHELGATITAPRGQPCDEIRWSKTIHPDGSATRVAACHKHEGFGAPSAYTVEGRPLAEEELDEAGNIVEADYYGQTGAVPDGSPIGAMFFENESYDGRVLDFRSTKVVHVRDGLMWTETFGYGRLPGLLGYTGAFNSRARVDRSSGNVVRHEIHPGAAPGTPLLQQISDFEAAPRYRSRNAIRLVKSTSTLGAGALLSRTDFAYDETDEQVATVPSHARGRDASVTPIGHLTTTRSFVDASTSVTTRIRHYDTGDVHQTIDGRGAVTRTDLDFAQCNATRIVSSTTTTPPPDAENATPHVHVTYRDCATDTVLATSDPNGNLTCSQVDAVGRIVETAQPGDKLTRRAGGVRYDRCATTEDVAAADGPTTWTDFVDETLPNTHRIVVHTKDGVPGGSTTTSVLDGLERTVQTCTTADPGTLLDPTCEGGACSEICTVKTYDSKGRAESETTPFASGPRNALGGVPGLAKTLRTDFDVIGRKTRSELVGSGLPATSTTYGSEGGRFVTIETVQTPARTKTTKTYSDLLGHPSEVAVLAPDAPGCGGWCRTTMTTDALGRVHTMTGPGGAAETISFTLDLLGRRTAIVDPDLGAWSFVLDPNGNVTSRKDAKGQTIDFTFDALNRMVKKTLPSGPDDERITLFCWDGTVLDAAGTRCVPNPNGPPVPPRLPMGPADSYPKR